MKRIIILLSTFLLIIFLVACKTKDSNVINNKKFEEYNFEPSISKIEGILTVRMFYGPPGYGENPQTDKKLYPYVIQLNDPIDVIASEDDEFNRIDKLGVTEVQVIPKSDQQIKILNQYINKSIVIEGTLFEAVLGHAHHTDVLLDIENILKNK